MFKKLNIYISTACALFFLYSLPTHLSAQTYFDDLPGASALLELLEMSGEGGGLSTFLMEELVSNQNPLQLSYTPLNPGPHERVTVSITDHGRPTGSASINWYVNGALYSTGTGMNRISLEMGESGEVFSVFAEISRPGGTMERTTTVVLGASHVDILWEAIDTKTPPFYKGKALASWDTIVRAYVVPEIYAPGGQRLSSSGLEYTWSKNQRPNDLNNQSGYGKESVFVLADFTRKQHVIGVDILHANTGISARAFAPVRLRDSEMLLYEKHPLQGVILERALPNEVNQASEGGNLRVVAYPYGLDSRNRMDVTFKWSLNGRTLQNTGEMNLGEIPLASSGTRGVSAVTVEARNTSKPLQSAKGGLRVIVE